MEDLRNMGQSSAEDRIKALGLTVSGVDTDYSDDIPEGCVMNQSIAAGTTVDKGTGVKLTISLGKKPTQEQTPDQGGTGQP